MSKITTMVKVLRDNPLNGIWRLFFLKAQRYGWLNFLNDKTYLKLQYKYKFRKKLNIKAPSTYNEKLQWLKLYDRKPEYHKMVDKYEVKKYVAERIGKQYVIPTLGIWDDARDIDRDKLPSQFVLKTTGGSGNQNVFICRDKSKFDWENAIKVLNKSLKDNVFWYSREWPYKGNKNRIMAEQYMEDTKTQELRDYKFFCMNGVCHALFVATGRSTYKKPFFDYFDSDYQHLDLRQRYQNAPIPPEKPTNFELMKKLASELSKGIPQIRVDLYEVNGNVYFGELTFFSFGIGEFFEPEYWDKTFGDWIELPKVCN